MQVDGFLPTSLESWLSVLARIVVGTVAAAGMVIAWFKRSVREEATARKKALADESKERKVADIERDVQQKVQTEKIQTLMGSVYTLQRFQDLTEIKMASLDGDVGEVRNDLKTLLEDIHQKELQGVRELAAIRSEVKDGFAAIKSEMQQGFEKLREAQRGER